MDLYEHIIYDGQKFCSILEVAPDLAERTIVINGVSKAYAMTGWRIGYAAGPERLVNAVRKVMSQATGCPSSVSQAAANCRPRWTIRASTQNGGNLSGQTGPLGSFTQSNAGS